MQFLRSVLGQGGGIKDLPYNIGDAYSTAWGSWTHYRGTSKEDGSAVSIFTIVGNNAQDARLIAARNGIKRLRTVRHPNVLSFLHSTEVEKDETGALKPTLYMVTEPVTPLSEKTRELNLEGTQRNEYYAWGLNQVAKAVSFLNNDCKLVHGNVCVAAVVVTPTLDWKLHALDVMSEFDGANSAAEGPMLQFEWLVPSQYKPLEVSKSDWTAVRKGPPHAIDSWGLGCLINELFSGAKLTRTEELRNTASIPKTLLPDYQRLLGSVPSRRLNSSKLLENSEFFQNKLVDTIHFMEVLNLKDSVEKDTFFRKLTPLAEQLPRQIVLLKLLPQLASALEFGSAAAPALNSLLKMGSWLPAGEFGTKVLPTVIKLFASPDRAIRIGLLQNFETIGPALSADITDQQIFNNITTGFSDSSAFLRELTLKSMLLLAPKLSQRTLTGPLLKHLSKLQVDEEPAIRTNTTILLGNIARHLNDSTRKRVLVNAFTVRALRDGFPPARSAGIMALMATKDYYEPSEIATRILPCLVILIVDPDSDVRSKAFQGVEIFMQKVRESYESGEMGASTASATHSTGAISSGILGWAVSSLTAKNVAAAATASPAAAAPLQTTTSAPVASLEAAATTALAAEAPQPRSMTARSEPSPNTAAAASAASNGWANDDEDAANGGEEEDDKDGWGDMDDSSFPAPVPALSRIQAAQQRPVSSAHRPQTSKSYGGSQSMTTATAPASEPAAASQNSDGWEDDDDPWAAIAAPKPVSSVKPLSSSSSGIARPTASSRQGAHVQLPRQAQHVSLESVLGGSGTARGVTGTSRGRGRAAPMKLGAQRINK